MADQICTVQGCARPAQSGLCARCTTALRDTLVALARGPRDAHGAIEPGLLDDLTDVVARLMRSGAATGVLSRSAEVPLIFHPAASEVAWVARDTLTVWARELAQVNPHLSVTGSTATEVAAWLSRYPALIAAHPQAADLHDEITAMADTVRRMVDIRPGKVYLGACGAEPGGVACTDDLYALDGASSARCRSCGAVWDVSVRRDELLELVRDQLAPAADIARALSTLGRPVTVARIGMWVHRGRLIPRLAHPADPRQRPRYRVGDILDLLLSAYARGAKAAGQWVA